ncbi:PIN domain-containing protein [Deinococcus knuensis]|uniref:PIN domain-containing protein n=1 Tax=Deinococcus knuensis TaxID=1837380 RepID=UPI0016676F6E|nr:PIN domain-containing protein [Deinococcus knuensis]
MTLFDTSALVAALVGNHPQFTWADAQVKAAQERGPLAVCAHTLAEAYDVMTAHPKLRYPPARVVEVLSDLTGHLTRQGSPLPAGKEEGDPKVALISST